MSRSTGVGLGLYFVHCDSRYLNFINHYRPNVGVPLRRLLHCMTAARRLPVSQVDG